MTGGARTVSANHPSAEMIHDCYTANYQSLIKKYDLLSWMWSVEKKLIFFRDSEAPWNQNMTALILWVSDVTPNQRTYWKPGVFYFTFPVISSLLVFVSSPRGLSDISCIKKKKQALNGGQIKKIFFLYDELAFQLKCVWFFPFTIYFLITFFPNYMSLE